MRIFLAIIEPHVRQPHVLYRIDIDETGTLTLEIFLGSYINVYPVQHVRLTVLETRVKSRLESGAQVGLNSLDVWLSDCNVTPEATQRSGNASVAYLSLPHPVLVDGWSVTTSGAAASEPRDPVRFVLHFADMKATDMLAMTTTFADCIEAHQWRDAEEFECMRERHTHHTLYTHTHTHTGT